MWLPLSFAVSSPSNDLMEIQTIFAAQPQAIQAQQQRCNPCHLLAAMMRNPLHLAARFTDNVAVIRELVQLHPPALK